MLKFYEPTRPNCI